MAKAKVTAATAEEKKAATGKRVGAIILWVLALACELVAIMNVTGKWYFPEFIPGLPDNLYLYLIIFGVLDLIFVIIGSLLWKKANRLDPASKSNKVAFFLQTQLGLIVAVAAFLPFILVVFLNKDVKLDQKSKTIVGIVGIAALVLASAVSIDYNPISAEEKLQAQQELTGAIYVTPSGHCYHTSKDCQSLANATIIESDAGLKNQAEGWESDGIINITEAIDGGYTKYCSFCQKANSTEAE